MPKQLLFLPGPVTVAQPVLEALARPLINHRGKEFAAMLGTHQRARCARLRHDGEIVLLGSSGTGAMEAAIVNVFSPGDRLLRVPSASSESVSRRSRQSYGCSVEALDTPIGAALDPRRFSARLEADRERRSPASC